MKNPYHLALILIFVQFIILQAKAQDWQFAIGAGGWVTDNSSCSTIDSEGNVYFGGYITDGEFGDVPVPSQGVFLVKTDSNGNVIWVRTSSGGNAFRQTTGIATDSEDNIYVIGLFSSNMYFEDIFLDGTGLPRLFLAKYTNQGDVLWAKAFNPVNTGFSSGMDVVVDHDDFVYITGHFEDTLIFDSDTLINTNQSSTYTDIFLARLTPSGDAVWAQSAGGNLDDYAYSINLHKNGTLLIAGQVYSSNAYFGNIQIDDDNPREKSYIVNYDNDGNVKWIYTSNQLFSTSSETTQITTDQKGNIYGFGNYFETIIFDDDTLHGSGNFIIKLDDLGNRVFSKSLSTSNYPNTVFDPGTWPIRNGDLAVDENNNLFLTTFFRNEFIFGQDTLVSDTSAAWGYSANDVLICKYNEIGYPQWVEKAGGVEMEYTQGISIHNNQIYLNGFYTSEVAGFGTDSINNNSGNLREDVFITSIMDTTPNTCPEINASLMAGQTAFCEGDSTLVTCQAEWGSTYLWLRNGLPVTTQYSPERWVVQPGEYAVIVNDNTACSDTTETLAITLYDTPDAQLIASPDTVLCNNDTVQLQTEFSTDYTYEWFHNNVPIPGAEENTLNATTEGWYGILASSENCSDTDSIYIWSGMVEASLEADPDTVICDNQDVIINTSFDPEYQYIWYLNDQIINNSNHYLQTNLMGNYEVFVYKYDCFESDQITLTEQFSPNINLSPDTIYFQEFPDTLDAGNIEANYVWYFENETTPVSTDHKIIITKAGKYYVEASNICGWSQDSIFVIQGTEGIYNTRHKQNRFSVFPNPNSGRFILKSDVLFSGSALINIHDVFGKIIYTASVHTSTDENFEISIPEIKKGFYFIDILCEENREILKVLIR